MTHNGQLGMLAVSKVLFDISESGMVTTETLVDTVKERTYASEYSPLNKRGSLFWLFIVLMAVQLSLFSFEVRSWVKRAHSFTSTLSTKASIRATIKVQGFVPFLIDILSLSLKVVGIVMWWQHINAMDGWTISSQQLAPSAKKATHATCVSTTTQQQCASPCEWVVGKCMDSYTAAKVRAGDSCPCIDANKVPRISRSVPANVQYNTSYFMEEYIVHRGPDKDYYYPVCACARPSTRPPARTHARTPAHSRAHRATTAHSSVSLGT